MESKYEEGIKRMFEDQTVMNIEFPFRAPFTCLENELAFSNCDIISILENYKGISLSS